MMVEEIVGHASWAIGLLSWGTGKTQTMHAPKACDSATARTEDLRTLATGAVVLESGCHDSPRPLDGIGSG